ncbi:TPM domain-containing protein [Emticicia sp. 17c]|uniref:TPM domain-containing protein n=1 Tax=Emticicia sp. 17c TaxID=3127704 RepID=UPI00301C814E
MFKKLLIFLFVFQYVAFAQDVPEKPNPARFVNDYVGGLLSQSQITQLETKLKGYYDTTSTQVVIVIVKSVQPYDISQYAFEIGKRWGIGKKDKNNGIVILWAPGDRKVFIATGYGMEGSITDAYSKRIIEQEIKPRFKELKYYEGLDAAVDRIINYAKGEYKADATEDGDGWFGFIVILVVLFIIIAIISRNKGGNSGNRRGGGWIPYTTYTGWGSSSGGWSGGGSSGGGGGGFDFGGGDFGGGGAGGDY